MLVVSTTKIEGLDITNETKRGRDINGDNEYKPKLSEFYTKKLEIIEIRYILNFRNLYARIVYLASIILFL